MSRFARNVLGGAIAVAMATGSAAADGHLGDGDGDGSSDAGASSYPVEILARPLTLPEGVWEASASLNLDTNFDATTLDFGGLYGLSNELMVGASYGIGIDPGEVEGPLVISGAFSFFTNETMQAVANGTVGYDLLADGLTPLTAGVHVQYGLNDNMAIITPGNQLVITLDAIDILGEELRPIFLQVPVAFGHQVDGHIYTEVGTNVATIEIADADTGFIFADFIPLTVAAFYAMDNTLDVGVALETELKDSAFDPLFFGLQARYRGGL